MKGAPLDMQPDHGIRTGTDEIADSGGYPVQYDRRELNKFGRAAAEFANCCWLSFGTGPTWSEVFEAPQVAGVVNGIEAVPTRGFRYVLIRCGISSRWLANSPEPRSLCAGHRYFAAHKGRKFSSKTMGRAVAQGVGTFRYWNHRSPSVAELAQAVRDPYGKPVFKSAQDLLPQLPWLTAEGWIRFEDGGIRRRPTAKADKQRAEARRNRSRGLGLADQS